MTAIPAGRRDGHERTAESVRALPLTRLIGEIARDTALLARKEIELARAEAEDNVRAEIAAAKRFGAAGVTAVVGLTLLVAAGALGLGAVLPFWFSMLIFAVSVLGLAGLAALAGWGKHVKRPLERTRRTVREDVDWARERLT